MKKYILKSMAISVAASVALSTTGCSSGSDDNYLGAPGAGSDTVTKITTGTVLDGILVGSTVCIDTDRDDMCSDEVVGDKDISNDKGEFSITSKSRGPLVLIGGVDSGTGQAFTGLLKAPEGSSVVTPLTSAVQALVEGGQSAKDAEANVKAALGIDPDVDLVNFDPFKEVGGANSEIAKLILAKQTQLQILVHTISATVAGADSKDIDSIMSDVFKEIVDGFDGDKVELDEDLVAKTIKTVADKVYEEDDAARVAVKVIADSVAEEAVRDANNAEKTIKDGKTDEAIDNLNDAITMVNTSTEDRVEKAVADATTKARDPKVDLEEIIRLQAERDRLEREAAEADAAAQKAKAEADAALQAATDKEAYEKALLAQAEAERLAAKKAEAEKAAALAAKEAAEAEVAIEAQRQAVADKAQAEAEKAEAERLAALAKQEALEEAAAAAKDADDLALAQAAAQAKIDAAAVEIARAEVAIIVKDASLYLLEIQSDAKATRDIFDLNTTSYAGAEAFADIADIVVSDAEDEVALIVLLDTDVAQANIHLGELERLNDLAEAELEKANDLKSSVDLAVATGIALAAKVARIQVIVEHVTKIDTEVTDALSMADRAADVVRDDLSDISDLDNLYDLGDILSEANLAAGQAEALLVEAKTTAISIATAKTEVEAALVVVDEPVAQQAESDAEVALATITQQLSDAAEKALEVEDKLKEATAIELAANAVEAARVAAAILASQNAAATAVSAAESSLSSATVSLSSAQAAARDAQIIANTNPNAEAAVATAMSAVSAAESALGDVESALADARLAKTASLVANVTEAEAQVAKIAAQDAAVAAATAALLVASAQEEAQAALVTAQNIAPPGNDEPSQNVQSAITTIVNLDPASSLSDTLSSIKSTLGDTNEDERVLKAIIEILEVVNSSEVNAVISQNSGLTNLDLLTGDVNAVVELVANANLVNGTTAMHNAADRLKNASDIVAEVYGNTARVIHYTTEAGSSISLNYNDSLAIRSVALAIASNLELISSYSYGDSSHFEVQTKDIGGESYEYTNADIDPLAVANQATFFKMTSRVRLANAGAYLRTAAGLIVNIDTAVLTVSDMTDADKADAQLIKDAFDGDGILAIPETIGDSIDLHALFDVGYIDRNAFVFTGYMGVSDAVLAEINKIPAFRDEQLAYDVDMCRYSAGDILEQPTQPTTQLNWNLINEYGGDTPRTPDTDLSIKYGEPVYRDGTWLETSTYIRADVNYVDCSVSYPLLPSFISPSSLSAPRFVADFNVGPTDVFNNVVTIVPSDEFSEAMLVGNTLYFYSINMFDGSTYISQATFNADGTRTYQVEGISKPIANYEITDDGGLRIFNDFVDLTMEVTQVGAFGSIFETIFSINGEYTNRWVFDNEQQRNTMAGR